MWLQPFPVLRSGRSAGQCAAPAPAWGDLRRSNKIPGARQGKGGPWTEIEKS